MFDTIKTLILSILGSYEPVMTSIYADDGTYIGDVVASGFAGVDWPFIIGGLTFIITMFCIFRIIGGVLKNV